MTWRRYAAGVFISAGLFVAGVLWHQRDNPHIAAEDVAALTADAWELRAVMLLRGAESPTNAFYGVAGTIVYSNSVGPSRLWQDVTDIADSLREHFRRVSWEDDSPSDFVYHGAPRWMFGEWGTSSSNHNSAIRMFYPDWADAGSSTDAVGRTYLIFDLPQPTNASLPWVTLDTREVGAELGTELWQFDTLHDQSRSPATYHYPAAADFAGCPLDTNGVAAVVGAGDDDEPLGDRLFNGSNNWWTASGLGANVYIWPRIEPVTNRGGAFGESWEWIGPRAITTNSLNDLRTVAGSMRQAVLVSSAANWDYWSYTTKITRTGFNLVSSSSSNTVNHAVFISNALAEVRQELDEPVTNGPGTLAESPALAAIAYQHYFNHLDFDDPELEDEYLGHVSASASAHLYHGFRCDWPADWCYQTGLVSRVRYYAVYAGTPWANPIYPGNQTYDNWYATEAGTETYAADTLGGGVELATWPLWASESYNDGGTEFADGDPDWKTRPPAEWPLTLIADVSSPGSAPLVDLGVEDIDLGFSPALVAAGDKSGVIGEPPAGASYDYSREEAVHDPSLYVIALVCVVDFDFTHYADGGKGEPYTPPWATNAPPATP